MGQGRRGAPFPFEALGRRRVRRAARQQYLQRDQPAKPRVARAVDLAHAAGAQRSDDFVSAEPGSWCEAHSTGRLSKVGRIIGDCESS